MYGVVECAERYSVRIVFIRAHYYREDWYIQSSFRKHIEHIAPLFVLVVHIVPLFVLVVHIAPLFVLVVHIYNHIHGVSEADVCIYSMYVSIRCMFYSMYVLLGRHACMQPYTRGGAGGQVYRFEVCAIR